MTKDRADLGFGDELESFDPAAWAPKAKKPANDKPARDQTRQVAEAAGFRSREAVAAPPPRQQRRRRTGRNAQFNIKAKPETIDAFCDIADRQGWGIGETLEYAVALLEREYKQPES